MEIVKSQNSMLILSFSPNIVQSVCSFPPLTPIKKWSFMLFLLQIEVVLIFITVFSYKLF